MIARFRESAVTAVSRAAAAVMPKARADAGSSAEKLLVPLGERSNQARYEAARAGRRLSNWTPGAEGVNTLLFYDGNYLRTRSRDIVRQNAWAANGLDALVSNMVGTGIRPRVNHDEAKFKEKVHKLWHHWTDVADAAGIQGFYGLQALAPVR